MQRTTSAFLMSTHPLVIAPRPNVAAKLATVGPCQTRAWVSRYGTPQAVSALPVEPVEFGRVGAAADHRHAGVAVDDLTLGVLGDEVLVARVLDVPRDLGDGLVPADVLPLVGAGPPDLGLREAIRVDDVVLDGRSLGAERAAVDRMVGIAFDVDDRGSRVLGLVAEGVDDHSTRDRAVGAGTSGLRGARDLELAHFRLRLGDVETESDRCSDPGCLEESAPRELHEHLPQVSKDVNAEPATIPSLPAPLVKCGERPATQCPEEPARAESQPAIRSRWE